ncbi:MAG TPA: monofunctional biosynthetic peptidoglycan transglycosylase [Terracidiphilus sp.]|nr:monofunctional biosynthetic peptidoglycan transglycosylase [Terracidiphilus sp.]
MPTPPSKVWRSTRNVTDSSDTLANGALAHSAIHTPAMASSRKVLVLRLARWLGLGLVCLWSLAVLMLLAFRWIDPPTTAVHIERRLQAWIHGKPYQERYKFVPLSQISLDFQHAVIAAEDGRFYQHHGFDWHQIQIAADDDMDGKRVRGASTLTQQLVKNLFFGTSRSVLRKGAEFTLVPVAELVLGKQRILELYLNEVEWGPGIYGAEAASRNYYRTGARSIDREQGARLAAILPLPLRRRPERMNRYSGLILERMRQMGW